MDIGILAEQDISAEDILPVLAAHFCVGSVLPAHGCTGNASLQHVRSACECTVRASKITNVLVPFS